MQKRTDKKSNKKIYVGIRRDPAGRLHVYTTKKPELKTKGIKNHGT